MAATSVFFILLFFSFSEATTHSTNGFTASLFHRDSSLSPYDRLNNAVRRSFSRSATLFRRAAAGVSTTAAKFPIIPANGEFLMEVSLGTPPVKFVGIADTGSDLTWTQCLPCNQCFNQSGPIFNPRGSSTYRQVSCRSGTCHSLQASGCGPDGRTCGYGYTYGDQSYTYGELGRDKITIGSFRLRNTVIGCGHENGGTFGSGASSGIIGLGGGSLSLASQLNKIGAVRRRFSYCLPNIFRNANLTGTINFGGHAVVSGRGAVSTPLVPKNPDTYYYLTLEAVSVGNTRHAADMSSAVEGGMGNIIIDSGTTLTFLPQNLYDGVVSTLTKVIRAKRAEDPAGILELCYATNEIRDGHIPTITAHFGGSAAVKLLPLNTFGEVAENVSCLTFAPSSELAIFGNLAQMNFLVGYDLHARRLSFKPTVCA
ncbi:aspartic proteinase CDR1-like [Momordica charantia]|uniref:Aspartic proteinase CDR1-like n=1 Tax=Momordica charantia TaxID=3673 RepID=A0A6J1C4J6_MOMCH|nr:aspartic proteinase CDR1-like [Momordica charantia]